MKDNISLIKSPTERFAGKEKSVVSVYIAQARKQYTASTSDLEIDDEPQVSISKDGAWVAAWVWVPREEIDLSKKRQTCPANT
jgi:hypothetical protein